MTRKTELQELADMIQVTARDMWEIANDLQRIADKVRDINITINRKQRNNLREDSIDILLQREGLPW